MDIIPLPYPPFRHTEEPLQSFDSVSCRLVLAQTIPNEKPAHLERRCHLFASKFRLPRLAALSLIGVMLLCNPPAWAKPAETIPQDLETVPDLDQLQQEVLEFWSLVVQGKKFQALGYVAEGQDHFLNWKWPLVRSYRVTNLDLKNGSDEVLVTTTAMVSPPGFGAAVSWPVRQRWVFRDQAWRILVEGSNPAAVFGGKSRIRTTSGRDQAETLKQFKRLQIGPKRIHFGAVLQGETIWQELTYKNGGGLGIRVRVIQSPRWVALDRSDFIAGPEDEGTWLLGVFTENLEGGVQGELTLELSHGTVRQEQMVSVLGSITPPLSLAPGRLVLVPGISYEIRVQNHTRQEVRIAEIVSPVDFLVAEWSSSASARIAPDGSAALKVTWDADRAPQDWSGGILRLLLDQPVAGRPELTVPILRQFP